MFSIVLPASTSKPCGGRLVAAFSSSSLIFFSRLPAACLHSRRQAQKPNTMSDEEEAVDPKIAADEHCAKTLSCAKLLVEYEKCAERIEQKGSGHCTGQYMDFVACVDACGKDEVFSKLK